MNILLVHQNFPGQFKHIAPVLGASDKFRVVAFTMVKKPISIPGVQTVSYQPGRGTHAQTHPWVKDFEAKVIRGNVAMKAARKMRDAHGFNPDLIFTHHGWGEFLFLKDGWPRAKMLLYSEWYYPLFGADMGFDPEFQKLGEELTARMRIKNAHNLLSMEMADAGLSPTNWQRDTHPLWFRDKIQVIHDGIDSIKLTSNPNVVPLTLVVPADAECQIEASQVTLTKGEEIITFINRNLEPYRGYHIFMRALPELLRLRPKAKVVIVGGNDVSYGTKPANGTWKQLFLDEVREGIDLDRVHFVGRIPYPSFVALMQLSMVHVYLTYPFVLSWSLMEAMACEAAIVASDTAPVREVIVDGECGRLVNFFSYSSITSTICELLDDPAQRARLGRNAREKIVEKYDLRSQSLPKQLTLIREVVNG